MIVGDLCDSSFFCDDADGDEHLLVEGVEDVDIFAEVLFGEEVVELG